MANQRTQGQMQRNLRAAIDAGTQAAYRALPGVADRIVTDVRVSLSSPVGPSLPGAPPARVTGALIKSYKSSGLIRDERGRFVVVYSRDPGAVHLELGRKGAAPRPALRPAVERARVTIAPTIAAAWAAGVRSVARGQGR